MIRMRIVSLGLACGLSVAIGAGGAWYYARTGANSAANAAVTPALGVNQTLVVPPPVRTVSWYQAHPDKIKAKLAACNSSPGTAMHDPECFNAASAKENSDIDHFIGSAPKDAQPVVPSRQ
jgi:hypothetical protein